MSERAIADDSAVRPLEVDVHLLGPVTLEVGGFSVSLQAPKERGLVAALSLRAGRPVATHELTAAVWGDLPPVTLRKSLQVHVSRVRRRIEQAVDQAGLEASPIVVTVGDAYALEADEGSVDVHRFEQLAASGRRALAEGRPRVAIGTFDDALTLWRADPLVELADTSYGQAEIARLTEMRLGVVESAIEARLALGEHRDVVAPIESLVKDEPLRERLWGQLMLALYRGGRQAEALRAFQRARAILVEELGIEPSRELCELESAIIAQDPRLDLATRPADRPPPVARSTGDADPADGAPSAGSAGIAAWADQIRAGPFVDRRSELALLERLHGESASGQRVVLVSGDDGVGKTRLVAELAARLTPRGVGVLSGSCVGPSSRGAALRRVVDRWAETADLDRAGLPPRTASVLGALSSVLSDRLELRDRDDMPDQYEVAAAVRSLLDRIRGDQPGVLVLDDLHLASSLTVEVLRHLVEYHASVPALVVLVLQGCAARNAPELLDLLDDLHRLAHFTRLPVEPLTDEEGASLLSQLLGVVDRPDWQPALTSLAHDVGGRPRYLHLMARHLADHRSRAGPDWVPAVGLAGSGAPRSIHDLVRRRLRRLRRGALPVLEAGAVMGDTFSLSGVATMTGVPEQEVVTAVEEARCCGIAFETGDGRARFACSVVPFVLRSELSPTRRARLSRGVRDLVER